MSRLVGLSGLPAALRNLGLVGHRARQTAGLQTLLADDGQRIPVRISGAPSGRAVVLVHGLGCAHGHWMPVARRLAHRCRVLAWDARGHGACQPLAGCGITLERLARDLHLLIDQFALERPLLVGHSMGALAVMQYLRDFGGANLFGVAFVDQSPRVVTDDGWHLGLFGGCSREAILQLVAGARQNLADAVLREAQAAAPGWLARALRADAWLAAALRRWLGRLDTAPLLDLAESLAMADFRPLLPTLDLPTWVVLGGRSPHYAGVPLDAYYRRAVAHARVQVYDHCGHSPHVAEPQRFADDLLGFIDAHR